MALPRKASGAKHVSRGDALGGRVILLCLLLVLNKTSVSRALVDGPPSNSVYSILYV